MGLESCSNLLKSKFRTFRIAKNDIYGPFNSPKLDFTQNWSGGKIIKYQQNQALTSHFESFWSIVNLWLNFKIILHFFLSNFPSEKSVLSKIIDGRETEISEYPWMVSLQLSGNHFCGGALISNSYVITAAHCMEFGNVSDFLSRLTVSLGDHDITDTSETRNVVRHVDQVSY